MVCEQHHEHTIEIDCAPGAPRPGDLIGEVIEGTGLKPKEAESRLFGNWTWRYDEVPCEEWSRIQPTLKARLKVLYDQGTIRFASW